MKIHSYEKKRFKRFNQFLVLIYINEKNYWRYKYIYATSYLYFFKFISFYNINIKKSKVWYAQKNCKMSTENTLIYIKLHGKCHSKVINGTNQSSDTWESVFWAMGPVIVLFDSHEHSLRFKSCRSQLRVELSHAIIKFETSFLSNSTVRYLVPRRMGSFFNAIFPSSCVRIICSESGV